MKTRNQFTRARSKTKPLLCQEDLKQLVLAYIEEENAFGVFVLP